MDWQYIKSDKFKNTILIGTSFLLLLGMISMTVILQWQFTARTLQIENASIVNNNRLNNIEKFFVQLDQQMQQQNVSAPVEPVSQQ